MCPIVTVDNEPMLDGGLADSIPILRARSLGFDNNVVVLTRNKGYRKPPSRMDKLPPFIYKQYPELRKTIENRGILYNEQLDLVEELEAKGEIVVIRPEKPIQVDRIERNIKKLQDLYDEGYEIAKKVRFE